MVHMSLSLHSVAPIRAEPLRKCAGGVQGLMQPCIAPTAPPPQAKAAALHAYPAGCAPETVSSGSCTLHQHCRHREPRQWLRTLSGACLRNGIRQQRCTPSLIVCSCTKSSARLYTGRLTSSRAATELDAGRAARTHGGTSKREPPSMRPISWKQSSSLRWEREQQQPRECMRVCVCVLARRPFGCT